MINGGKFTIYDFKLTELDDRMRAFQAAYCALPEDERCYVDEAVNRIIEHVKGHDPKMRFSPSQALEVLGVVLVYRQLCEIKGPPVILGASGSSAAVGA